MEARLAAALPAGEGWQFEPKWDGCRFLAFREGDAVALLSKSGKPLGRFFPEVVARLRALAAERFVLDGELIIAVGGTLAFDALQARLHPAESRIRKLAAETPAAAPAVPATAAATRSRRSIAAIAGPACCSRPVPAMPAAPPTGWRRRAARWTG